MTLSHRDNFNIGRNKLAAIRGTIITTVLRINVLLAWDSGRVSLKTLNALNIVSSRRTAVTIKVSGKKALSGTSYPLGHPPALKMQSFGRFKI